MADLSHWDFAAHFSGAEAAALILGLEPRDTGNDHSRIHVVTERLRLHYDHALQRNYHEVLMVSPERFTDMESCIPLELESLAMSALRRQFEFSDEEETPFSEWLRSDQSNFEDQIFSRMGIGDWLEANGLCSIYQFRLDQLRTEVGRVGRWPWGDYHTEKLEHLEAAARRYWVNYDPTDLSTAPRNEDVSAWLCAERKVSKTMADSIASMLRVDGLATGPR